MGQPDEIKMKLLFCFDKIVFLFHLYDKVKTKNVSWIFPKCSLKITFSHSGVYFEWALEPSFVLRTELCMANTSE